MSVALVRVALGVVAAYFLLRGNAPERGLLDGTVMVLSGCGSRTNVHSHGIVSFQSIGPANPERGELKGA